MFEESDCILVCYKLILSSLKLNVFFVYFQGFYSFYSLYGFHALEINKPFISRYSNFCIHYIWRRGQDYNYNKKTLAKVVMAEGGEDVAADAVAHREVIVVQDRAKLPKLSGKPKKMDDPDIEEWCEDVSQHIEAKRM